ncbi:hypothetical protein NYP20_14855 [Pseudomonas sp. N3-W]|uniref:hypothetical protein n=1 Tax=Pseudomonas sp. N3-W TaxID=2975049 RepID=UPI00217F171D|nr:hypothetical protein [Pseudomonas sp. N3-W]UWF52166.1 hypothetical protein NYP20_14855 [Pseudomonas sp. N3-W]
MMTLDLSNEIAKIEVSGRTTPAYPVSLTGMGVLLRKEYNEVNFVITIFFKPESPLMGLKYKLVWLEGDLGVPPKQSIPSLDIEKVIDGDKITIEWTNFRATKEGRFKLELQCEGCQLIIPGVVVNELSTNAVAGGNFDFIHYPSFTEFNRLRYPRDGIRRKVRVLLNSSLLAELMTSGFIKPSIFLSKFGVDHKITIDPVSGSALEIDVTRGEFSFDMWGEPFNFGGTYEVNINFPYRIQPIIVYCFIDGPSDARGHHHPA